MPLGRPGPDAAPDWVKGDYPQWLAPAFARAFAERAAAEGAGLARRAPVDLRANTLKANRDKVLAALRKFGAEAGPLSPWAVRIPPPSAAGRSPNVEVEPAHARGWFEVQDAASQVAALMTAARPGMQVADICAGAGGKTLALAAMMQNKGQIHAHDADRHRLKPIFERLKRAGARNVQVIPADEGERLAALAGRMDVVLVDAPCSGSGSWRRKPDAKWRLTPKALEDRLADQRAVLAAAFPLVKPGGRLVYVTCSVLPRENGDQVTPSLLPTMTSTRCLTPIYGARRCRAMRQPRPTAARKRSSLPPPAMGPMVSSSPFWSGRRPDSAPRPFHALRTQVRFRYLLAMTEHILIIDFGSQVTQLIARRVREAGVYSEIVPYQSAEKALGRVGLKGIILSGGPASVLEGESPRAPERVFSLGLPVLGICYGEQAICAQLGGKVEASDHREFGRAFLKVTSHCPLFDGVWGEGESHQVWMSHGDRVVALPEGFHVVGTSEGAPFAAICNEQRQVYGLQFHPEVVHTPDGARLYRNFVRRDLRLPRRLVHGLVPRPGDPRRQEKGRLRERHLRPVGRRRQRRDGGAHPRGDRHPAHLHLRRPRPDARRRGRRGGAPVPRFLQHSPHSRG